MKSDATITFSRVIPVLRMFDVAKAREFYLNYLGFSIDFEARFPENAPLYMQISRGDLVLRLSEHHGDGTPGTHLVVDMHGIQAFHEELSSKHYAYMNPGIGTSEWGTCEFSVIDPFGNVLNFSEKVERAASREQSQGQ